MRIEFGGQDSGNVRGERLLAFQEGRKVLPIHRPVLVGVADELLVGEEWDPGDWALDILSGRLRADGNPPGEIAAALVASGNHDSERSQVAPMLLDGGPDVFELVRIGRQDDLPVMARVKKELSRPEVHRSGDLLDFVGDVLFDLCLIEDEPNPLLMGASCSRICRQLRNPSLVSMAERILPVAVPASTSAFER